jgi:hypothetical protein
MILAGVPSSVGTFWCPSSFEIFHTMSQTVPHYVSGVPVMFQCLTVPTLPICVWYMYDVFMILNNLMCNLFLTISAKHRWDISISYHWHIRTQYMTYHTDIGYMISDWYVIIQPVLLLVLNNLLVIFSRKSLFRGLSCDTGTCDLCVVSILKIHKINKVV